MVSAIVISQFLAALHAVNSSNNPNFTAVSQNKTIWSFPVVIDELS